jgi:nitroreductase
VRRAGRCAPNPSSGNLHPTEGYVLLGRVRGSAKRRGFSTTRRCSTASSWRAIARRRYFERLMRAISGRSIPRRLASVHWREAWKYGERAFRYCQHDVGHAIAPSASRRRRSAGRRWC